MTERHVTYISGEELLADIELAVLELPSVARCAMRLSNGRLIEIHVEAADETDVRSIVRNVESLIYLRFGLRIDRRIVSVVSFDTGKTINILLARFRKAEKLADLLDGEGVTYRDTLHMQEENWRVAIQAAGLESASTITRVLACELLRDREERKHRG
jgi:hypothetical protein